MYVGGFRCVWSGVSGWMDGWIDGARVTFHFNDTPTRPHKFSQLEADEVGVLLCARAGYDPAAAIRVRMYACMHASGGRYCAAGDGLFV